MPNESTAELQDYVRHLRKTRERYLAEAEPALAEYFRGHDRSGKPPRAVEDTSMLFMRSHDGDSGARPLGNVVHWHSPDLRLVPLAGTAAYTNTLEAGRAYRIQATLRNRGDLAVPFPKLELFLTDPSLGFDTRFATRIATTQYNGILLPDTQGSIEHVYHVPATESGHKCLFARTWSYSPPDLPLDLHVLDPRVDRRIAQQNLHIVGQGQPYAFQVIHLPNADDTLEFRALSHEQLLKLGHPFAADFKLRERLDGALFQRSDLKPVDADGHVSMDWDHGMLRMASRGDGPGLEEQAHLHRRMDAMLSSRDPRRRHEGAGPDGGYRELVMAWRKLHAHTVCTRMTLTVPSFGLAQGEAGGFSIVCTNRTTGTVKGGIHLIVTG